MQEHNAGATFLATGDATMDARVRAAADEQLFLEAVRAADAADEAIERAFARAQRDNERRARLGVQMIARANATARQLRNAR